MSKHRSKRAKLVNSKTTKKCILIIVSKELRRILRNWILIWPYVWISYMSSLGFLTQGILSFIKLQSYISLSLLTLSAYSSSLQYFNKLIFNQLHLMEIGSPCSIAYKSEAKPEDWVSEATWEVTGWRCLLFTASLRQHLSRVSPKSSIFYKDGLLIKLPPPVWSAWVILAAYSRCTQIQIDILGNEDYKMLL